MFLLFILVSLFNTAVPVLLYRFLNIGPGTAIAAGFCLHAGLTMPLLLKVRRELTSVKHAAASLAKGDLAVTRRSESGLSGELGHAAEILHNRLIPGLSRFLSDLRYLADAQNLTSEALTGNLNEVDMMVQGALKVIGELSGNVSTLRGEVQEVRRNIDRIQEGVSQIADSMDGQRGQFHETHNSVQDMLILLDTIKSTISEKRQSSLKLTEETGLGVRQVKQTSELVGLIAQKKDEILDTVSVVNDIAEQINLLGMNAAIEAAHSGEAGRGFAIVAEQVRALSIITGKHAEEIGQTLSEIGDAIKQGEEASSAGEQALGQIDREAQSFISAFEDIAAQVERVTAGSDLVGDSMQKLLSSTESISQNTQEMSRNALHVKQILASLDKNADANAVQSKMALSRISAITGLQKESLLLSVLNGENSEFLTEMGNRFSVPESEQSDHIISFIALHQQNRAQLRQAILRSQPSLFTSQISASECPLGIWLSQNADDIKGSEKLIHELTAAHEKFHKLTAEAVILESEDGRHFEAVQTFLQTEECTTEMAEQLFALYKINIKGESAQDKSI